MTPRATYRIQFHEHFTFDQAAGLAPYLARLGVSHLYASPYLKAHPGSTHGYDIVDHAALNPELGGEAGFDRMAAALAAAGLRQILDFVPNHMGVGGADNLVWLDLLEWGQEAEHAGWFDVDWTPDRTDIRGKVLVPLLGDQYGAALEQGQLVLRFDPHEGSFAVWAHEAHKLPVNPLDYRTILGDAHPALEEFGDAFSDLMSWRPQVMRRARRLKRDLAGQASGTAGIGAAIEAAVARFNGRVGDLRSWDDLAALIERQHWKPTHFLVAADDINYRRFFNIATLAGLRMELPELFDAAHRLVFALMRKGVLDGLRIDHIDGLFDPLAYLARLRREAPPSPTGAPFYLVVEKILGRDEALRDAWPVEGTTGYDFTNLLTGLFVHGPSEGDFTRLYRTFTGETRSFADIVLASKRQIIDDEMSSELHRLARAATRVARQSPRTADFTLTVLQRALRHVVAAFPVYRTYIDGEAPPGTEDRADIDRAIAVARGYDAAIDASVFDFLRRLLSGDLVAGPRSGFRRADVFRCAMKVQQYCGPVMAKGVEDTAFYRYYRFVALNEVGGSPDHFGVPPDRFHAANRVRAERWPAAMLATSTHDTKRGEDTRARLAALSGLPDEWGRQVRAWSEILRLSGRTAHPDRNDEYLFYQLLVGTWPVAMLDDGPVAVEECQAFAERLRDVMTKSIREAKVHSTWVAPDAAYEAAALGMVDDALRGPAAATFLAAARPFATRLAALGASNSFAQTVLKFTVPGMPDIYQGAELWDLTMVDPDNRRPVDYAARAAALDDVEARFGRDRAGTMSALWAEWRSGHFKLALTLLLLRLRASEPDLFAQGSYEALAFLGPRADRYCGFVRRHGGVALVVVVAIDPWDELATGARLEVPAGDRDATGEALLTGAAVTLGDGPTVADMLGGLPAFVGVFRQK